MPTTVTTEQVERTIVDAIVRFGPDVADVTPAATFEVLDIDSLDLVELAQIVEDEFGVKFANDDLASMKTVGDVVELVVARSA